MVLMALWVLQALLIGLLGMGAVAFITLLERKILGLSQARLGPNKVSMMGLLQPVGDGLKLLSKQNLRVKASQMSLFFLSPMLLMVLFILVWVWFIPWAGYFYPSKHNSLLLFSLLGVSAYSIVLTGWSATSGFSKLGSMRGILQSLSYEVALILIFTCFLVTIGSFNISVNSVMSVEMYLFWASLWCVLALMETNRAPFDLLEGESELISGFNIEMGSLMFVYLFLSEYGMVMVMALITDVVLNSKVTVSSLILVFIFLLFRSCFPRFKYDSLMMLMWQIILPMSVVFVFIGFF